MPNQQERIELVHLYSKCNKNVSLAARIFNQQHPNRKPVHRTTITSLINRFNDTGSVSNRRRADTHRTKTDEITASIVLGILSDSPTKSLRMVALECNMSVSSVRRILKEHGWKAYKPKLVHELLPQDHKHRLKFCKWYLKQDIISTTMFTDEAIFYLKGSVQQLRYWAPENPHPICETKSQYNPRIMVWAGIIGDRIIGPFFFDQHVTGMCYF